MATLSFKLKKGDRVLLAYGEQNNDLAGCDSFAKWLKHDFGGSSYKAWQGVLLEEPDFVTGIVYMSVEGFETEAGSVYVHDIIGVLKDGTFDEVIHTPETIEFRDRIKAIGSRV